MKHALTGLGKAIVIVMGVGYGVATALDAFSADPAFSPDAAPDDFTPKSTPATSQAAHPVSSETDAGANRTAEAAIKRLKGMEERLAHLEKSVEALTATADHLASHASTRGSEHFVTRAELDAAMERFASTLDTDVQRRFDIQNRSVQSLRTMVARTDELLEQVLETIESVGAAA